MQADPDQSIYLAIFGRTFVIGVAVTLFALLLGYPLAYWISTLSERRANLVMILVLIPFWTSVLVRVAAWIVLLQNEGHQYGADRQRADLASADAAVQPHRRVHLDDAHPAAVHDPAAVQRDEVDPADLPARGRVARQPSVRRVLARVRAADLPGVGAGALLVFILAIGYYITPALLGGPNDQMVGYYVAYFTNVTINWGMACALGGLLLAATLVLYAVYGRFTRTNVSLG